jgi:hypothetical protein
VISPFTGELSELILGLDDSTEDSLGQSSMDLLEKQTSAKDPSPFSAKRVVHESDTPHDDTGTGMGIHFSPQQIILAFLR